MRHYLLESGRRLHPLRRQSSLLLRLLFGSGLLFLLPQLAQAQNCRLHYGEAFQLIPSHNLAEKSPATIKGLVDDLFGPRQEVCGEAGYKFFLNELGVQAAASLRQKGSEQEARLIATREIMTRFPMRVRWSPGVDPAAGLNQLRSDLGVLSSEVGVTPPVKSLLEALAKVMPPRAAIKPLPKDDDAVPIQVPKQPLPAWAVISLYEIHDHAARKETEAIAVKSQRILDWMARPSSGDGPSLRPVMSTK